MVFEGIPTHLFPVSREEQWYINFKQIYLIVYLLKIYLLGKQ